MISTTAIGVYEAALAAGPVAEAIQEGASERELREALRSSGTPSLLADSLQKVSEGVTSLEEALGMKWA